MAKKRLSLPKSTLGELSTELNKQVFEEGREDLEPLREEVRSAFGSGPAKQIAIKSREQSEANQLLQEREAKAKDRAGRMDANIFGDTQAQAEMASEAARGFRSTPGTFLDEGEEEILKTHRNRPPMERRIDESKNAEIADSKEEWLSAPDNFDWPGIDTKR